jgi:hypothetical protein
MTSANPRKMKSKLWLIIPAIIEVFTLGFLIWAATPSRPMPEAMSALQSDAHVSVEQQNWLEFSPTGLSPKTGFIFYPGGHVDARAYAPASRSIAEAGFLVVIVRMPLNLAVLNPSAASDVMAAYPGISTWVVGGHSLGGAMAANFVFNHPSTVDGLILWAAYPASSNNLSTLPLRVVSISSDLDGLSTVEKIAATRQLLPEDTSFIVIEGGNHAQFGWYGEQPGDSRATITRQEQQLQLNQASLDFP